MHSVLPMKICDLQKTSEPTDLSFGGATDPVIWFPSSLSATSTWENMKKKHRKNSNKLSLFWTNDSPFFKPKSQCHFGCWVRNGGPSATSEACFYRSPFFSTSRLLFSKPPSSPRFVITGWSIFGVTIRKNPRFQDTKKPTPARGHPAELVEQSSPHWGDVSHLGLRADLFCEKFLRNTKTYIFTYMLYAFIFVGFCWIVFLQILHGF